MTIRIKRALVALAVLLSLVIGGVPASASPPQGQTCSAKTCPNNITWD